MIFWETADESHRPRGGARVCPHLEGHPKIVFSRTLEKVEMSNARLVRDGAAEAVAKLKEEPGKDLGRRRRRPGLDLHQAGPDRRVPALHQSGRAGRGHALLPGP